MINALFESILTAKLYHSVREYCIFMKLRQIEAQARKIKIGGQKTANFNFSKVKKRIKSPFIKGMDILLFYRVQLAA